MKKKSNKTIAANILEEGLTLSQEDKIDQINKLLEELWQSTPKRKSKRAIMDAVEAVRDIRYSLF